MQCWFLEVKIYYENSLVSKKQLCKKKKLNFSKNTDEMSF